MAKKMQQEQQQNLPDAKKEKLEVAFYIPAQNATIISTAFTSLMIYPAEPDPKLAGHPRTVFHPPSV